MGSGIVQESEYTVKIVDYDGQTMNLINTGVVKILPLVETNSVGGIDNFRIQNGQANLSGFSLISQLGAQGVLFEVVSSHIDYEKIQQLSTTTFNALQQQERARFEVNFRQ